MAIRRIAEPDIEPVTLTEAKSHLRVTHSADDALIALYISAARQHLEDHCHRAIAEAEWELTLDGFPDAAIDIPVPPLIGVGSIKYDDADGVEQTMDADDYIVDAAGAFGRVAAASAWPSPSAAINSVRIRFTAGWANTTGETPATTVPFALRAAILLMAGHLYENREAVGAPMQALPLGVEDLAETYVVPVIA